MNHYLKFGRYFFILLFWLIISDVWIVKLYLRQDYSSILFFGVTEIIFVLLMIRFLYFKLFKIPVLSVNESCIIDHFSNMKYYWTDIDEIVETNDFLYIHLYNPKKYLSKVYNPLRFIVTAISLLFFRKISPYYISLHIIDIERRLEFSENLNNYSIASLKEI